MRLNSRTVVLLALVCAAMTGVSLAQRTTATFAGIVTDPSGAVLPGAEIELINEGTSAAMQQLTGETGEFIFNFVPVGNYTLKISMAGFKSYEGKRIPVGAAQNMRRTYVLEVGAVSESVTVTGEAPLVNTISPEQRLSLETLEVKNLPMINRNISNILEIGAGLSKGEATDTGRAGNRLRLNGLGGSAMSITADGTDGNGNPGGAQTISTYGGANKIDVMSSEAVAEVQVVKGVMSAEYASAMAGNLSLITKSGTNEWHGSLLHRYEGSALSARNAFLKSKPNSVWNQFGGSLGGPVKRDKLFFFTAFEGYRQHTSDDVNVTVPTPYFRDIISRSLPFPETKLMMDFYPIPNQPHGPTDLLARWIGPGPRLNTDDHVDGKIDYLVSGGTFSMAASVGHPYQSRARSQPLNPQIFELHAQRVSMNYVIGRARWTSSTRMGFNRNFQIRLDKWNTVPVPGKAETIPGARRVGQFSYPGMASLGGERQTRGLHPSWSFEQQTALIRGSHSWKFGALLAMPSGGKTQTDGNGVSFQTLQDVMQNTPSAVNFSSPTNPYKHRMHNFGFFAQDDWRAARKLVLNLGVRYDRYEHIFFTPTHEDLPACICNLDGLRNAATFEFGPPRDRKDPFNSDPFSLGPRFGFAYTVDNRGDFVVRGGFGVNFQGFDAQTYEVNTAYSFTIPNSRSFSRAEAAARGLKYPVYAEDLWPLILAEAGNRTVVGARYDPNTKPPYAMNYTLGIQRALTSTTVLETAYVGTRGVKFTLTRTYNQLGRVTGIRPNPNQPQGNYNDSSQQTNYNSLQVSLKQRMTHGLLFNTHYTWGKAMAYTGGDISQGFNGDTRGGIEDFDNVKIERSPSAGDVTHEFIANWVYELPTPFATSTAAKQILGGWQISGIWKTQTGQILTTSQTGGRPDLLFIDGAVNKNCCGFGNIQYLNPNAFQLVDVSRASSRTVRRGSQANGALRGPGLSNLDLSIGKNFSVSEGKSLEFKADLSNALNQPQYASIATNLSSINFGQVTGTRLARVIQLQLRLAF